MPSHFRICGWLIGLIALGGGASFVVAQEPQSVALKSVELAALKGAERDRFLAAHLAARKAVGVGPLAWSDELSKVALDWLGQEKDRLIEEAKEGWETR